MWKNMSLEAKPVEPVFTLILKADVKSYKQGETCMQIKSTMHDLHLANTLF